MSVTINLIEGNEVTIQKNVIDSVTLTNVQPTAVTVNSSFVASSWGFIDGTVTNQTDLVDYIDAEIAAIPTPPTPTLDSVTTQGGTTTNSINVGGITAASLVYPSADGTTGQIIQTNGSGTLSFVDLPNDATWGNITGTVTNQADLTSYVDTEIETAPYATSISDSVNSVAVGGAPVLPASTWKTKTIIQSLDTILFPTILPSIGSNRSVTLTINGSTGNREVGVSYSRTLTANFNRGTIINGDGTTNSNPLVGPSSNYRFTGTGISQTNQTGNTLAITTDVVLGDNDWDVLVTHGAGTGDYYDNKGNAETNLDSSRAAGTRSDTNASPNLTGYYPYYWGVSNTAVTPADIASIIQGGGGNKVIGNASGTVTITFNASTQYLWMVHYGSYTTKQVWYNTALNNGSIGGASDLFGPVNTQSVDSPDGYWSGINYKCYISTFATTTSGSIQFRNS